VRNWLVDYMYEGEVFAMVLEWAHAIEVVRKLVWPTVSLKAPVGTIRGDYSCDSVALANYERRPIKNLIHASGNKEEADFEVELWFWK
jgi:nucleoside-diphosphate kinase